MNNSFAVWSYSEWFPQWIILVFLRMKSWIFSLCKQEEHIFYSWVMFCKYSVILPERNIKNITVWYVFLSLFHLLLRHPLSFRNILSNVLFPLLYRCVINLFDFFSSHRWFHIWPTKILANSLHVLNRTWCLAETGTV